jgi:RND family efflux transporter MFP subunit
MRSLTISSKVLLAASLLALVSLAACSGNEEKVKTQSDEVVAEIATATLQMVPSQKTFNGTLKSDTRSEIGTKVMGEVEAVSVNIGDQVAKGELILKIKDEDLEAKKKQAEAGLEEAKIRLDAIQKDYNRYKNLYEKGSATPKEWDDIRTQFQSAKSRVLAAESQLKEINDLLTYTQIKAPYEGVIAAKYVQVGDIVTPGRPLIAIEKAKLFKVEATIPESEISGITVGDSVTVKIPALKSDLLMAKVSEVSASGNPQSRQFQVEFELLEVPVSLNLRSGLFAEIVLQGKGDMGVAIPSEALVKRGQLVGIYTLNANDEALLRWIRTGNKSGNTIEVLSGLSEGERYVRNGSAVSRDGIRVVSQN